MQLSFARTLKLYICKIDIKTHKIDSNRLATFNIVIEFFTMENQTKKFRFFKETFLMADISINITLKIFFIILHNVKINFTN